MAQKFLSKVTPDDVGGKPDVVQFILGNGLRVEANLQAMPTEIQNQLKVHGASQKIGDAAAGFSKALDYSGAFGAMQQVVDNLVAGQWSTRGQGGGLSDLIQALVELRGVDVETVQAAVDAMDEDQLKAIVSHPRVRAKIADIKTARLQKAAENAPDLDDLLDI